MVLAGGVPGAETTGALRNRTVIAEVRIRNSRTSQVAGRMGRMGASARIFATLATRKLKDLRWSVTLAYSASQNPKIGIALATSRSTSSRWLAYGVSR